jgi:hypothetical protein
VVDSIESSGSVEAARSVEAGPSISRGDALSPAARRQRRVRAVQIALGCVWILDAGLQFQPKMFGQGLVNTMILPMANGQPAPVSWSITTLAHFIRPDVGVWNFLFGFIQLLIGLGMLFRRTVKPAIVAMAVWALGVWWFGEGFGMLLTGAASPLTGAPGAVLLYPAIGLLVWPTGRSDDHAVQAGIESSASATGPLGTNAPLFVWSGFWLLSAVLWLFPANRGAGAIASTVSNAANGQPGWFAHFETSVANALPHGGSPLPWILAALSVVIAAGPWLSRRPQPFLAAGIALEALFWVTGMAFGGMLTGMGTDPNVAPLVALLAFSMLPTLAAVPARAPGRELAARHPLAGAGASIGVLAVLLLSSTYPVASAAASASAGAGGGSSSSGSAMAGMSMNASSSRSSHARTSGDQSAMSMPGMDGNADPGWHYTGPPLPAQEQATLTTVFRETEKGHAMQTPDCAKAPTGAQVEAAMQLIQTTSSAVSKYKDLNVAKAAGYFPITDTRYPVVHYVNPGYLQQQYVLDPNHVQSLVYAFTPYGPVLVAAMYLMPTEGDNGPMPGGCLTQWHAHTNLCSGATGTIQGFMSDGVCPAGENHFPTPEMLHVWQVPVPGGPLTMDPTDQQVVEAAIMAQQAGQAPMTPGAQLPAVTGSFGT